MTPDLAHPQLITGGQLQACYIGDHAGDGIAARLGVAIIRWAQKGARFADTTHCEQILELNADGTVWIASATLRRENAATGGNGVRIKRVALNPAHWRVYWCPQTADGALFDAERGRELLHQQMGKPYDLIGAVASAVLRLEHRVDAWFCTEICGAMSGLIDAWQYTPARYEALLASIGTDVTAEIFRTRPYPTHAAAA